MKKKNYIGSGIVRALVYLSAGMTVGIMLLLVGYILVKGIPHLKWSLFEWKYTAKNLSMMPALINTVIMTALTLLCAVPVGVFSAIYLVEYAHRGTKLVHMIRVTAETLAGIPSIVYGLFGYLAFVLTMTKSYSMLAGVLTLAVMVLPTIMRTTEEALLAVPDSYREGSFGLGAGKLRTIFCIILPTAKAGIASGIVLAIGRIVGETAALIFTAGTYAAVPNSLLASTRTIAVHLYCLLNEGLHMDEAYATAVILLLLVIGMNLLSRCLTIKKSA